MSYSKRVEHSFLLFIIPIDKKQVCIELVTSAYIFSQDGDISKSTMTFERWDALLQNLILVNFIFVYILQNYSSKKK